MDDTTLSFVIVRALPFLFFVFLGKLEIRRHWHWWRILLGLW